MIRSAVCVAALACGPIACAPRERPLQPGAWGRIGNYTIYQEVPRSGDMPSANIGCVARRGAFTHDRPDTHGLAIFGTPNSGTWVVLGSGYRSVGITERDAGAPVPVTVGIGETATYRGAGRLSGEYFYVHTSAETLPGLLRGEAASFRFEDGRAGMRQAFPPETVAGLLRCYSDAMVAGGRADQRVAIARDLPNAQAATPAP